MDTYQRAIVSIIEAVHAACGYERATVCARDCLLQWDTGGDKLLSDTIAAWRRFLSEKERKDAHSDENRHGAWVPAIPL